MGKNKKRREVLSASGSSVIILPDKFLEMLVDAAGEERAKIVSDAIMTTPAELSVRMNPAKRPFDLKYSFEADKRVPWCEDGCYLSQRPDFTLDPLLHAGAYYVQESSSMFIAMLGPILKNFNSETILDLCAAPGGKSTHLASLMPPSAFLYSNEVIKSRVGVLNENMAKWGNSSVKVISRDPSWFRERISGSSKTNDNLPDKFDFILVDAPCSGEGMFRKDPGSVAGWSEELVHMCAARQRRIMSDIWDSLAYGGFLAYSTCTFNRYENDLNVAWFKSELGAQLFSLEEYYSDDFISLLTEWGVVKSPEGGYQFFPGIVKGEGFYFVLLRKPASNGGVKSANRNVRAGGDTRSVAVRDARKGLTKIGGIPDHNIALLANYDAQWPSYELSRADALKYLSRQSFKLIDAPVGYIRLTYKGLGLGFANNLGSRINNLYPVNWRIRKQW